MIDQARRPDVPTPGLYAARLVRGGPEVACRIVLSEGHYVLLVLGHPTHPEANTDPWKIPMMQSVAMYGRLIDEDEYQALWTAIQNAQPGEPLASPTEPVDFRRSPSLY